jgi:D-apionolactonase
VRELSVFQRWYGRDEAPTERHTVRAGPLTAELEGPDLRYVRAGGIEIVRRLYAAVRDQNWGTVPPTLSNVELDVGDDEFSLRFDARNLDPALGVDVSWRGALVGGRDGTLACTFDGTANVACRYNRIGWCVLHPAEHAGRPFRARTPDGVVDDRLPAEIGPQLIVDGLPAPLFPAFDELEIEAGDGVTVRFDLEGDLFEMEDQRNWTDASFKTYSTPLSLGFPHEAEAAQTFKQSVRLAVDGVRTTGSQPSDDPVVLELGERAGRLPALGLGTASHGEGLSEREAQLLTALRAEHLRVDVDPAAGDWRAQLTQAAAAARAVGARLELAVFAGADQGPLEEVAAALRDTGIGVARVLAFRRGEPTSSAATVELVRRELRDAADGAPVYGGTNVLFTDLNRFRPDLGPPEGIAWPLNATVHASDDTSVMETAAIHGETVRSARAFCGELPLAVTPITFNQRFNPVATGPEPEPGPGELPSQVDRRQPSLLGAGWTLASLKHLAEAGAASATYFETTGWRGVIETEAGTAVSEAFCSSPGMAFPIYHVLADLGEWRAGEVVVARSSAPLAAEAFAVRADGALHLLVANLTPVPRRCRIPSLRSVGVTLRRLDERSFAHAGEEPEAFRAAFEEASAGEAGLELQLAPFETVRIDTAA